MEYKGFTITIGNIRNGKMKYTGLIARKKGIRIESPLTYRLNHKAMKSTINNFLKK